MADKLRILYVDDEPDLLDISKLFLEESGDFTVTTALSADEGIRLLEQDSFDAIVSDYQMPCMDGIQFLVEVRKRFGSIPFILFTGRGREEVVIQAINSGADFYLQKGGEPGAQFAELAHKVKAAASGKRADDALRISEERHRTILQTTTDGFWILDAEWKITDVNETYCRMSGYTKTEILKMRIPDLDSVEEPAETAIRIQRIITKGSAIFETRHRRKDGSFFDVELSVTYQNTNGGKFICFCRDISERKQVEKALLESRDRSDGILATLDDAIFLVDPSTRLITMCNNATTRIFGYSHEELVGNQTNLLHVDQEHFAQFGRNAITAYEDPGYYTTEFEMRRKDGSVFPSEHFVRPIRDADGRIKYVVSVVRDITERKLAEEALQQSEERYRSLYIDSRDAIMILSPQRGFLAANPATIQLFAFRNEQNFIASSPASVSPEYQPDGVLSTVKSQEMIRLALEKGSNFFEWTHRKSDGTDFPATILLSRLESGGTQLLQATVRDITERKRAEQKLLEAQGRIATVLEGIADTFYSLDDKWRFTTVNAAAEKAPFGRPATELLGKVIWELYPGLVGTFIQQHYFNASKNLTLEHYEGLSPLNGRWYEVFMQGRSGGVDVYLRDITERKRAEDALRKSEERYKNISETTSDFVFSCIKPEGGTYSIDWIAGAVEQITGYTIDELRAMVCWRCLVHPDDIPVFDKNITNLSEVASRSCILRIRTKNGTERWLAVNTTHMPGKDSSSFCHVFGGCRDVTEHKLAEEVLKQSEEKYRTLFEGALNPILITDEEGRYVDANAAALEFLETEKEELVQKTVWDYSPQRLIEEQKHEHGVFTEPRTLETVYSVHGKEKTLILNILPMDMPGKQYVIGIGQDITERKRLEEAHRESEEKFRLITDTIDEAFWMADVEIGKIFYVSPSFERIWGFSKESLYKNPRSFLDAVHKEDLERVLAVLETEKTGQPFDHEYRIVLPDGNIRNIWDRGFPIRDENGQISIYAGIAMDITNRKRAEETLKESEEFNRNLVENLPDYIIVYRPDGKILYANPATVKEFGYNLNELVGTSVMSYVAPECRTRVTSTIATRLKGDDTHEYETVLITKEGQRKTVIAKGTMVHYHDGLATLLLLTDITERKVAERVLLESEEKYRVIFNNDIYAICIFDLETLNLLDVNDAFTKLYGYTRNELLSGMTVHDITAEHEASDSATEEAISHGTIFVPLRYHKKKDNTIFPVEIVGGPYLWNGKMVMFALTHDITNRKIAEETLKNERQRLANIIKGTRAGTWEWNVQTGETIFNEQWANIIGYTLSELSPVSIKTWTNYAHPDDLQKSGELLEQHFLQKSEWYECESRMKHKNGHWVWVLDRGKVALWTKDKKPLWMYGTHQDITERKELEKEMDYHELELRKFSSSLASANKKLTLLSSITRHDINNQLTVLMGYLTLLKKKQPDPAFDEYFGKVSTAVQRISSMIQFTREYECIGIKAPAWQDCRTLVDTAAKQAPLGKVVVKNDLPDGTEVFADPLVVKVFYNLMDNAVRYGGKITTIRFSVEEAGDGDHLIVCEDDGNGVVADEKEKIFERGFGKNTGMGLFLAREILDITGITIRETGEPGKGARFEMTVPKGACRIPDLK